MANRSAAFYSGSNPGAHQSDTAPTFDEAQADSERASQVFLSNRTEADFRAWREQRTRQAVQPLTEVSLRRCIRHARPRRSVLACGSRHGGRTLDDESVDVGQCQAVVCLVESRRPDVKEMDSHCGVPILWNRATQSDVELVRQIGRPQDGSFNTLER
jgi:hypothetical protein